jgi:SAM-dependent methyltransferase
LRIPFRDRAFDAVFALDLVEHVQNETTAFQEAIRVLRRRGRLIFTTPHNEMRIFPGFLQPWVNRKWGHHRIRGFRPEHLARILHSMDVRAVRITCLAVRRFRWGYLPLSAIWHVSQPLAQWLVRHTARADANGARGPGGSLLIEAVRGP